MKDSHTVSKAALGCLPEPPRAWPEVDSSSPAGHAGALSLSGPQPANAPGVFRSPSGSEPTDAATAGIPAVSRPSRCPWDEIPLTVEGIRAEALPSCPCCGATLYPDTDWGNDPDRDLVCRVCRTYFNGSDVWGYWRVRREVAACEDWAGWPRRLRGVIESVEFLAKMHGLKLPGGDGE